MYKKRGFAMCRRKHKMIKPPLDIRAMRSFSGCQKLCFKCQFQTEIVMMTLFVHITTSFSEMIVSAIVPGSGGLTSPTLGWCFNFNLIPQRHRHNYHHNQAHLMSMSFDLEEQQPVRGWMVTLVTACDCAQKHYQLW